MEDEMSEKDMLRKMKEGWKLRLSLVTLEFWLELGHARIPVDLRIVSNTREAGLIRETWRGWPMAEFSLT
jgi:hypothetical protein